MRHFIVILPRMNRRGDTVLAYSSEAAVRHFGDIDGGTVHAATLREHAFVLGNGSLPASAAKRVAGSVQAEGAR